MICNVTLTGRDVVNQVELLDNHRLDDQVRLRALHDVARANAYFGGVRVVRREFQGALNTRVSDTVTVLDVGIGLGDLGPHMRRAGQQCAVSVKLVGVDLSPALAWATRRSGIVSVCGDGLALPFKSRSVDIVVCSQLLHHFSDGDAVRLLRELDRVARRRVIVCDLRRSWVAAGGFWLASHSLGFHPVTRHDGVVSVRRGFTRKELTRLVGAAVGQGPVARRSLGFRLAVSWTPGALSRQRPSLRR